MPRATPRRSVAARREPYRRRLTLDFAAGDAVVIPGYGGAQGIFFVASDLLGDNLLFGSVSSYQGRRLGSILVEPQRHRFYLNQSRRVNWGLGAFRTKSRNFEGDRVIAYDETAYGGDRPAALPAHAVHPGRGHRRPRALRPRGLHAAGRRAPPDRLDRVPLPELRARQLALGPERPHRRRPLRGHGRALERLLQQPVRQLPHLGDWRQYLRLGRRSAWALRAYGFYSAGDRPRRVNIGGTLGLRGYPQFGYIVGSEAFMFNQEVRFPLLTHLTLGTPLGDVDFPEIQAGLFTDVGKARFPTTTDRALLGSYGVSFRMALGPLTVLRLDVGRRFSNDEFRGYSLSSDQRDAGFVSFFFGYNY